MSGRIDTLAEELGLAPKHDVEAINKMFPRRPSDTCEQPQPDPQHPFEQAVIRRQFEAWYPRAHLKAIDPLARYRHNGQYIKPQIETAWRAYLARAEQQHFELASLRSTIQRLEEGNRRLKLTNMTQNSPHEDAGTIWLHIKSGGLYRILGSCLIEATETPAFAYRSLSDGRVWVRPMAEFMDGRFEQIEDDDLKAREAKDG